MTPSLVAVASDTFISYHHVEPDQTFAGGLAAYLRGNGITVFMDTAIPAGARWAHELEEFISASRVVVVLLSKAAAKSDYVVKEINIASALEKQGKLRIIPIRIDYDGSIPVDMAILDRLQQLQWKPGQPEQAIWQQVTEVILGAQEIEQRLLVAADYPAARAAFDRLSKITGWQARAQSLLADFWQTRALYAAALGSRDEALLSWLHAATIDANEHRLRGAGAVIGTDLPYLSATFRAPQRSAGFQSLLDGSLFAQLAVGFVSYYPKGGLAFNSDCSLIAACWASKHEAYLWKTATGDPATPPLAHKGAVFAVAFSTNGKLILTGSWDNSAQLWRTDTGERIGAPLSHKHAVTAVAFRPDGEVVATVSWNTVQLWSVSNQEPIGPPLKHKGLVWSAVFDESGNTLVTRSFETKGFVSEVVLTSWKLSGGDAEPLALGKLSHGGPAAVDLPSNTVAIGKQDGCARIWRIGVDELEALTPEHIGAVNGVAIRSGGDCLATAGDDGTALIWSVADRAPIQPTLHHDASVTAVAFGADDRIATQTADGAVRVWAIAPDVRGRKRSLLHDARVCSLYLSPNSDLLVTLCVDGRLSVWEVTSQSLNKHVQTVRQGELADVDSRGTAALIVDKERKLHMCRFDAGDLQPMGDDPVRIARFIPSTTTVLAGGEDGVLRVISESGQLLGRFDGHGAHIVSLACSVDGSRAITGGADKSAIVWSLPRCEKMGPALLHDGEVTAAALSDDGTAALTQSAKRLHLWNLQTVEPAARPIQPNDDSVMCCFNGAGTLLANAMRSRVLVFDTESSHRPLRAVHHVQGRLLGPMPIRFQSDGRGLIAASTEFGQVVLERFDAGSPAGAAIEGDPHELHERWQERLGLRFDSRKGNYVTRHP